MGGLLGRGMTAGLGQLSMAFSAVTGTLKKMQDNFETVNAGNRFLAGYNGQIAGAFNQLALGDMHRNIKLGRATEGSAVTLANLTNQSREIQGGYDRLNAGLNNRSASVQAVLWNGLNKPWSMAADALNNQINVMDPKGDALARLAASPFSGAAGAGAFLGSLWAGSTVKEAADNAQREIQRQQKQQLAGVAPQLDPMAAFIISSQKQGPIRAARPVKL